jgi:hypothetical protein
MLHRRMILPLLVVLVFGLAPLGYGQFANHSPHRTLGYYDPATGAFEPVHPAMDLDAPPVAPTTGTLVLKLTLSVKSTIPKNAVIACSGNGSVFDSSGFSADEHGSGIAKLVSGTTYSCTVTLPYSWPLASASTDKISLSYSASIDYGYQVTATNGTAIVVEPVSARNTNQSFGSISVPVNGATTTENISATI